MHTAGITNVAGHDLDIVLAWGLIQPPPRTVATVMHKGPGPRAGPDEVLGQMAADETTGTRDEHARALEICYTCHNATSFCARL